MNMTVSMAYISDSFLIYFRKRKHINSLSHLNITVFASATDEELKGVVNSVMFLLFFFYIHRYLETKKKRSKQTNRQNKRLS